MLFELLLLGAPALSPLAQPAPTPLVARDEVDDLIAAGRKMLDEGDIDQALVFFEEADGKTGQDMRTRVWVLRCWIDKGRYNDAFNEADRRQRKGEEGPALDYIYGMGSYRRALDNMAAGGGSTTQLALIDAATYLGDATKGDGATFDDAWTPLAHAAYLGQEPSQLAMAVEAAAKGVAARPKSHRAHYIQGLTSLWQVIDASGREDEAAKKAGVAAGLTALEKAAQLLPDEVARVSDRADYHLQAATLAMWTPDPARASREYALAMAADPSRIDFSRVWSMLAAGEEGAKPFVACLEEGAKGYVDRWGEKTQGDATLLWWLGYAQVQTGDYEAADANLALSVEKWPAYENAYWYQFEARYQAQKYEDAAQALGTWWERNPSGVVAMVQGNQELNVAKIFFTQGKCAEKAWAGAASASICAEVLVAVEPRNWERWDNLGLFTRDAGDAIKRSLRRVEGEDAKAEAMARANVYYERSWEAYGKALELAPEQPHLHNDAAVILHYCLDRDFEQAIRMYERSQELAVARLKRTDLEDFDRQRTEIAKRDSANNLRDIKKLIETRRKEAQKEGAGG